MVYCRQLSKCIESTGKKKYVEIPRNGVYLKPCLVEVAHSALKIKLTFAMPTNSINFLKVEVKNVQLLPLPEKY